MSAPPRAVAAVRSAVRESLAELPPGSRLLVAVSGGPDSMALAAATSFVAPRAGMSYAAVIVDHGLQADSPDVARRAAEQLTELGFDPATVRAVEVNGHGGPEAAARAARYRAVDEVADAIAASAVLLGHTLDDQAETVLLGLVRGSGARSIRGMAPARGRYRRPLLRIPRTTTREFCRELGLAYWDDPHNDDDRFTRSRIRARIVPALEQELGPGITQSLARTASLVRDDDDALEQWADEVSAKARVDTDDGVAWDVAVLGAVPAAVRRRVMRSALLGSGVPGGDLRATHLADVDALVAAWKGQGEVHLPGGLRAFRSCGRLLIARDGR